jgi:hypothetical protein
MFLFRVYAHADWKGRPTQTTAFRVIVDETNNTPERIDRNELWASVFLKPTRAPKILGSFRSIDEAIAAMDSDVRSIMIDDLLEERAISMGSEEPTPDADHCLTLLSELSVKTDSEIKELWCKIGRWEMEQDGRKSRSLIYDRDSEFSSFVYHLLDDNHEPVQGWSI